MNVSFEVQRNLGIFARHGVVLIRTENGGTSPSAGFASNKASYQPMSASPCSPIFLVEDPSSMFSSMAMMASTTFPSAFSRASFASL